MLPLSASWTQEVHRIDSEILEGVMQKLREKGVMLHLTWCTLRLGPLPKCMR